MLYYWPKSIEWKDGCLEVVSKRTLAGGKWVGAQTWGWVIFYRDERMKASGRLNVHERVHVSQGFKWGPLFPFMYAGHWLWNWGFGLRMSWIDAYYEVWAEVEAYDYEDEYKTAEVQEDYWGHR